MVDIGGTKITCINAKTSNALRILVGEVRGNRLRAAVNSFRFLSFKMRKKIVTISEGKRIFTDSKYDLRLR